MKKSVKKSAKKKVKKSSQTKMQRYLSSMKKRDVALIKLAVLSFAWWVVAVFPRFYLWVREWRLFWFVLFILSTIVVLTKYAKK
jgi:cation transport ATPase